MFHNKYLYFKNIYCNRVKINMSVYTHRPRLLLSTLSILILFFTPLTHQAVITAGDISNNIIAPTNGAPWQYVGKVSGGASAIYLGNGWALTAFHSGPGDLTLGSNTYTYTGTSHRLSTLSPNDADMILFKISGDPGLLPIPMLSTPANVGSQVTMIGYGLDQGSLIQWDSSWNTIPPSLNPMAYQGYSWLGSGSKKWGLGNINAYQPTPVNAGSGPNWSFNTTFLFMEDYGQGASGDSGGGVFYYDNSEWQLAGMMFAITAHTGQPGSTSASGNQTYHANIVPYKAEILAVTSIPEPSTYALIGLGTLLLFWASTRRLKAKH